MKVFIVNLKNATDKRASMERQLIALKVQNYEFFDAVNGKDLPIDLITQGVYDYPKCALTRGEIGCSFSHLNIYRQMVEENISSAIVLEDDIVIPDHFPELVVELGVTLNTPESKVISLGKANKVTLLRKFFTFKRYGEYTAVTAFGTYAYAINLAAAKSLSEHLYPIRYEADMFMHFRENGWLKYFNILYPQYIYVIPDHDEHSDINTDREMFKNQRYEYKEYTLLKNRPLKKRLKNRFFRIFWKIKQIKNK